MRTGSHGKRMPNWLVGLILVVVIAVASVLSYTKQLPWTSKYEVQAVFASAGNVRPNSQVRIAGVQVGKVTTIENLAAGDPQIREAVAPDEPETGEAAPSTAAVVTMELEESALPLHTDATMKLRPRLFLEGNLFVDLKPGSPNAPVAEDGYVFPAGQTSLAVSLDEVLTTLQSDVRANLRILLDQLGNAFADYGGAEGFREFYRSSGGAFRYTSQVNEAFLGKGPRDLSDLIVNLDSTVEALGRNEGELQDLVTNLRTVLGSFAAESDALERGIAELPRVLEVGEPALASLNASFPAVRAFAREALPGVRSTPAALDAAIPFLRQLRGLVSEDELRGLVSDLRPAIPDLARLSKTTIPFLRQARLLSSCANEVIVPWSNDTVSDPATPATARVFEELGYGLTGISGESRSGDANGPYIRVLAGGGTNTVVLPNPDPSPEPGNEGPFYGVTPAPIEGVLPSVESSAKTPFRPNVRCETQEPPILASEVGPPPPSAEAAGATGTELSADQQNQVSSLGAPLAEVTEMLDGNPKQARRGYDELGDLMAQLGTIVGAGER